MRLFLALGVAIILNQATSVHAQLFMPRVGIAISKVAYVPQSPPGDINSKTGVSIGVGMEFHLIKNLSFLFECDYISKGHKFYSNMPRPNDPDTKVIYSSTYKHNYLEVPLILKKYWGKSPVKFYLNTGGYAGVGIGGTAKSEFGIYDRGNATSYDLADGVIKYGSDNSNNDDIYYDKRIDVGLLIGTGILLFDKIAFDVRYGAGMIDIDKRFKNFRNRTLQFGVVVPLKIDSEE